MEAYAVDVEKPFSVARVKFDEMATHLSSTAALGMRHEDLEEYVVREGRELERRMLQEHQLIGVMRWALRRLTSTRRRHVSPGARPRW